MSYKVKAVPFLIGAYGCHFLLDGSLDFAVASTVIFAILALTKQVDLI